MKRATFARLVIFALFWIVAAPNGRAQSQRADPPHSAPATSAPLHFDVASIRPTDPNTQGWRITYTVDGLDAQRVTLRMLIKEAYAAYEDGRILGGPSWLDTDHFDIRARLDPAEVPTYKDLTLAQRREMLRALLAERFQLTIHPEQRSFSAFALRIVKGGPKLQKANEVEIPDDGVKGYHSLVTRSRPGLLEGKNFSMPELAKILEYPAQRIVVDETGLNDRYDFLLQWTPLDASGNPIESSNGTGDLSEKSYPFFFAALEQELGLKLEPTKTMVEVFIVDHAQPPSSN